MEQAMYKHFNANGLRIADVAAESKSEGGVTW